MQDKIFKVKNFEVTHKSVKSVKVFSLEIFRLYGTKCLYWCGASLIKCFNSGINKLQYRNMGITNFWSVEAI